MKGFKEYLTESKKTYAFKIKLAGDLADGCEEKLKTAMERFAVEKMGAGKRTPITETPLDFPTLKNTNVTIFDIEIKYPTTTEVLENYISQCCNHPLHCVKVVTANAPSEQYQESVSNADKKTETLLTTEDMGGESAQDQVGQTKISNFLKELSKDSKEREVKDQPKEKAAEAMPEGSSVSPIGSTAKKGK